MAAPAPEKAPSRALPALAVVALLAGSLAVGILAGGLHRDAPAARSKARGLRADVLPAGLAGHPAPAFRLRDARGGAIDTRALRGRPYALTFLYTHCPDVCPVLASKLGRALAGAPDARVVAVSVDPRGDTPATVRAFAAARRLPPSFRYAIGRASELAPVWRSYFVTSQLGDPRRSTHTASVWLVDGRGRLRGMYPGGAPVAPGDVAHDLRVLS
jgi:protein SCO1/2